MDVSHFHCMAEKLQGLVPAAHLPLLSFRAQLPPDFTHGLLGVQSFHLEQSTAPPPLHRTFAHAFFPHCVLVTQQPLSNHKLFGH